MAQFTVFGKTVHICIGNSGTGLVKSSTAHRQEAIHFHPPLETGDLQAWADFYQRTGRAIDCAMVVQEYDAADRPRRCKLIGLDLDYSLQHMMYPPHGCHGPADRLPDDLILDSVYFPGCRDKEEPQANVKAALGQPVKRRPHAAHSLIRDTLTRVRTTLKGDVYRWSANGGRGCEPKSRERKRGQGEKARWEEQYEEVIGVYHPGGFGFETLDGVDWEITIPHLKPTSTGPRMAKSGRRLL